MFIEEPNTIQELIHIFNKYLLTSVFRGLKSVDYKLETTLSRYFQDSELTKEHHRTLELKLYANFKRKVAPYLKEMPKTDWELLTLMRHHCAPTRLMDWTYYPFIAAFFAIHKNDEKQACVWALSKTKFSEINKLPFGIVFDPALLGIDYLNYLEKSNPSFLIAPRHWSARSNAQAGLFLVSMEDYLPMEDSIYSDALTKIIINEKLYPEINLILFSSGITTDRLFPDIDGLAKAANEPDFIIEAN